MVGVCLSVRTAYESHFFIIRLESVYLTLFPTRKGIKMSDPEAQTDPNEHDEINAINARRADLDLPQSTGTDTIGLALSGGGIRSAVFNLGLIRALAKKELLRKFDYLSTVSGGGYVGAMLERLYQALDPLLSTFSGKLDHIKKVTNPLPGDDITFGKYQPHLFQGPIHLITCCINQTVDDRSRNYNADRKGIALTVSAFGAETGTQRPSLSKPVTGSHTFALGRYFGGSSGNRYGVTHLSGAGVSAFPDWWQAGVLVAQPG